MEFVCFSTHRFCSTGEITQMTKWINIIAIKKKIWFEFESSTSRSNSIMALQTESANTIRKWILYVTRLHKCWLKWLNGKNCILLTQKWHIVRGGTHKCVDTFICRLKLLVAKPRNKFGAQFSSDMMVRRRWAIRWRYLIMIIY